MWPKTLPTIFGSKDRFPESSLWGQSTQSGQDITSLLHIWVLGCGSPKE